MKKTAAALVVILSSASIARSAPAVRGVVLQSCERVNKFCVARIMNVSHKNVVALGMGTYRDNHLTGESMNFYSYSTPESPDIESYVGGKIFPPGTIEEITASVDADTAVPIINLNIAS